jgi:hypothetical protein
MATMIFYVYEHWRPDLDVCFWVGKGHGNRAYDLRRNFHYNNVVKKLSRLGMCVEVRLVQSGLAEDAAFALERERIAFWRSAGVQLANYTDGGEGVSGLRHSEATKQLIREKRAAQKIAHSAETKKKIGTANSVALKGRKSPEHSIRLKGRKLSPEHRAAIGRGLKGHVYSPETLAKLKITSSGRKATEITRERLRISHQGKRPTPETRAKMTASQTRRWARIKELT